MQTDVTLYKQNIIKFGTGLPLLLQNVSHFFGPQSIKIIKMSQTVFECPAFTKWTKIYVKSPLKIRCSYLW